MCTSFSLAIRGRLLAAFHTQPAGLALFAATVLLAAYCANIALTRRTPKLVALDGSIGRCTVAVGAILVVGWVYKLLTWIQL